MNTVSNLPVAQQHGYCFLLLRPETVAGKLIGIMLAAIEAIEGCTILRIEMQEPEAEKIRALYAKPELDEWRDEIIVNHLQGSIVVIFVKGGPSICHEMGKVVSGLRAKYTINPQRNNIHSSDSTALAIQEAKIFFQNLRESI